MSYQLSIFGNETLEDEFQSIMRMVPAKETDYATHNIHPYPAKFLPHYPRIFIRHYSSEGDLVVDPMCGSGTTLAEACLNKRRAFGLDIDPIAALISKVSITPLDEKLLREFRNLLITELKEKIESKETAKISLPTTDEFPNFDLWFREETLKELLLIRNTIFELNTSDVLKNFALLNLSAIIKPVSNADPRDIFPERDLNNPIRERKEVLNEYISMFHKNTIRVIQFSNMVNNQRRGTVSQGDARDIKLKSDSVPLIFSSPPYAYAMDYARVHQLSTLMFIMNNKDFREYRRKYIGTDRISVNEAIYSFEGYSFAKNIIQNIYQNNKKLGVILYKYFYDMHMVTKECYRILKPGGHLIYVVGNSTVRGTELETDDVFKGICQEAGFRIVKRFERPYYAYRMSRKRNVQSNTIKSDVFLVAQKPVEKILI